ALVLNARDRCAPAAGCVHLADRLGAIPSVSERRKQRSGARLSSRCAHERTPSTKAWGCEAKAARRSARAHRPNRARTRCERGSGVGWPTPTGELVRVEATTRPESLNWQERRSVLVLDHEDDEFGGLGATGVAINYMDIAGAFVEGLS